MYYDAYFLVKDPCKRTYCAKFETCQTFEPITPNISFVPWSPKRDTTMLDPFAQFFQHCWGHARALHTSCLQNHMGGISSTMHCRSQYSWELLHPFAHHCQHGPTILGIVARSFRYITDQFNDQLPVGLLAQLVKALHWYRVGQDPVKPGF